MNTTVAISTDTTTTIITAPNWANTIIITMTTSTVTASPEWLLPLSAYVVTIKTSTITGNISIITNITTFSITTAHTTIWSFPYHIHPSMVLSFGPTPALLRYVIHHILSQFMEWA